MARMGDQSQTIWGDQCSGARLHITPESPATRRKCHEIGLFPTRRPSFQNSRATLLRSLVPRPREFVLPRSQNRDLGQAPEHGAQRVRWPYCNHARWPHRTYTPRQSRHARFLGIPICSPQFDCASITGNPSQPDFGSSRNLWQAPARVGEGWTARNGSEGNAASLTIAPMSDQSSSSSRLLIWRMKCIDSLNLPFVSAGTAGLHLRLTKARAAGHQRAQ